MGKHAHRVPSTLAALAAPVHGADGIPVIRWWLVPRPAVTIETDWDALGLRGSGLGHPRLGPQQHHAAGRLASRAYAASPFLAGLAARRTGVHGVRIAAPPGSAAQQAVLEAHLIEAVGRNWTLRRSARSQRCPRG